uniref:MADF domain-containing protein n=1 Tax=Panagrellus redivivus TaxID=6233 RepID=A0A7E4W162_PANRE
MDPYSMSSSMKTEAYDICNALEKTGSIVKHFSDFPMPPRKNRRDMQRYINELKSLQRMGKIRYNYNQRSYISHCVTVTKQKMARLEEQERSGNRSMNGGEIIDHPMARKRTNSESTNSSIGQTSYVMPNVSLNTLLNTSNGHNVRSLQTNGFNPTPPAKRLNAAPVSQPSKASSQPDNGSNQLRAIDLFIKANPEISMEEAFLQFSYLDTKQRSWFDNLEKVIESVKFK